MFKRKIIAGITSIILGTVLIFILNVSIVHANSLNANEAAIISAAQGTFDSNGISYKVDPQFIGQLISYLSQEDVDLNADQKDEVIGMMFSNIESGVAEGYLIPVNEQEGNIENQDDAGESEEDVSGEEDTISGGDKNIEGEITTSEENSSKENETQEYDNAVLDEIRKQPTTKTEVDQNKNRVIVTKEDNSNVLVVNTVIKNTGYNLTPVLITISVFVLITIICLLITIKYNFFKQEDQ
ncbi:MAG: hypothetical protein K0S61_3550 [Anaerocolumna sp.]|jgi:hypothetical protein|nr:hypothetical protein [Anaerocolumna sp.]